MIVRGRWTDAITHPIFPPSLSAEEGQEHTQAAFFSFVRRRIRPGFQSTKYPTGTMDPHSSFTQA